jgi:stress-induced morphogen
MSRVTKNNPADSVEIIRDILDEYRKKHPEADVQVKRQNPVAVRIRIVDPDFSGVDLVDREKALWKILDRLPARARSDITFLLLLTPDEKNQSMASFEFDHPIPSRL